VIDWKIIAGLGGFAFIISLLTGLVSGVQFGILLLRAIVGGAVFAGLGFGGGYLIEKFLPELLHGETATSREETGGTVDIVVNDKEEEEEVKEKPAEAALSSEAGSTDNEEGPEAETEDQDSFVEEVEETASMEGEETVETIETEDEDDAEVVEELTDADDTVEALPEIDSFSDSFTSEDVPDAEGELSGSGGSSETLDVMGEERDPNTVVKAIQTMIKRDE
jgi:predicted lipid-binding transport protein (Tim44 family)